MKYLIPYDFTPITRAALDHAFSIATNIPGEMQLLHVISKEEDREEAEAKFVSLFATLSEEQKKVLEYKIRVGDIFKDISSVARDENVQLFVMGTHGAKGLQKLFGSYAIKVIMSSDTPFIITQEKGPEKAIERIVLPVNLSKESVQIADFAGDLAKKFNAEVHIVCKHETDEWLANKLRINLNATKAELRKDGVNYEVVVLDGKKSFHKEVIDYGEQCGVGLFAIAHFSDSILPQFDVFSQEMITNRLQVPVLIMKAYMPAGVSTNYSFLAV